MEETISSRAEAFSLPAGIQSYPNPDIGNAGVHGKPLHLAIGMFDGVHLGHQAVIRQAMEASLREQGHCSGVLTFDPHPSRILYPKMATRMLMPLRTRIGRIHGIGVDLVFVQTFTMEYARQEAVAFLPSLLRDFPLLQSIHVGENFRFGSGRKGNIDTLRQSALDNGVELHALQRKVMDGMAISSSRIRAALMEGSIEEVNSMLGEPYTISGRVVKGKGIGRRIEYPTLNVPWDPEVSPRYGVYLVNLFPMEANTAVHGIANYGIRPTVGAAPDPLVEVHLLESGEVPVSGDAVRVQLLRFIRPERNFETLEALKEQIRKDVAFAKTALEEGRRIR